MPFHVTFKITHRIFISSFVAASPMLTLNGIVVLKKLAHRIWFFFPLTESITSSGSCFNRENIEEIVISFAKLAGVLNDMLDRSLAKLQGLCIFANIGTETINKIRCPSFVP